MMRFERANSLVQAVEYLVQSQGKGRVLAGGSDLLVQMKSGSAHPQLLVDIKTIDGLGDISTENGGYRIGAVVSGAEMGEDRGLVALWPGVVEAVELIGSTQIQGRATLVGNLCNGSPAADAVPALVAAGAIARVVGVEGTREIRVADIPLGPGRTVLENTDIIDSVFLPARPDRSADAYLRFIPRTEMDIAVASAAVNLTLDQAGVVQSAMVVLGAVAPTVVVADDAASALVGTKLDSATLAKVAAACAAYCTPIDDKRGTAEFRTKIAGVMAKRAALIAYKRAGGTL